MAAKLPSSPLERLFPDYEPALDPVTMGFAGMRGMGFLSSKFAREDPREDDRVYMHFVTGPRGGRRELECVIEVLEDIVKMGNRAP